MKHEIRLALLCMAATAAPAIAQNPIPQCGYSNFDQGRNVYTVMSPADGAVNQECTISVHAPGAMPEAARQNPSAYLEEGNYVITLSGGGGGGGGGSNRGEGGGGGGAGAAVARTSQHLSPGTYKMNIGAGGSGGAVNGGRTGSGSPTSLTNISTGQVIAGYSGPEGANLQSRTTEQGVGGVGKAGGANGGAGGDSGPNTEEMAQAGARSSTSTSNPGQPGIERGGNTHSSNTRVMQSDAGGGGGASYGAGGDGQSITGTRPAGEGQLGGGGGGGRGGVKHAAAGARGGDGFIRLALTQVTPVAAVPERAPMVAQRPSEPAYVPSAAQESPAPVVMRPARQDRN
jgi:hypothetical protein